MSTHNLCFRGEIRKIMYTPVNPSFTIYKWGLRGSKFILACFRDDCLQMVSKAIFLY